MPIQEEELSKILEDIRSNRILKLGLRHRDITLQQVTRIAKELTTNTSLISLDLEGNREVRCQGAEAIADVLKRNRSIIYLNLGECEISDRGMLALAKALEVNRSLIFLNLSFNAIWDEGAKAIAGVLSVNHTLTYLCLLANSIMYDGAKAIAEALKINRGLISIDIFSTILEGFRVGALFRDALASNKILLNFNKNFTHLFGIEDKLKDNRQTCYNFLDLITKAIASGMQHSSLSKIKEKIKTVPVAHQIYALKRIVEEGSSIEMIDFLVDAGVPIMTKMINFLPSCEALEGSPSPSTIETSYYPIEHSRIHERIEFLLESKFCDAVENGSAEAVEELVAKGSNINQIATDGERLLFVAARKGYVKIVAILIANGANINQADNSGMTLVAYAAYFGKFEVVKMLIANGANIDQVDNKGATPLEIARQQNYSAIVKILERAIDKQEQQKRIIKSQSQKTLAHLEKTFEFQKLIIPIIILQTTDFSLKSLKVTDEMVVILTSFLADNYLLVSLDLSNNKISSEGAAAIIKAIKLSFSTQNHNLTHINLDKNPIPNALKTEIQSLIALNQQIQADFIGAVRRGDSKRLEELFAKYLKRSPKHLEELYLVAIENNFQINRQSQDLDPNFKAVSQIIIEIIALNLSQNHPKHSIDQQKLDQAKSNALKKQPEIHKKHFFELIVQIEQNQINYLNLQDYDIGDEGVIILVKALKINKSVTNIDLGNNKISNQGANYLISFLTGNKFVQNINLLGNNIDDHLLTQIDELLLRNQQLQAETLKLKQSITQIESLPYQDIEFRVPQLNKSNQLSQHPLKIIAIIDHPNLGQTITCVTSVNGRQILQEIQITDDGNVLYKISNNSRPFASLPLLPQDLAAIKNLTINFTQILTNLKQSQFAQLDAKIKQQGGDQEFEQTTEGVIVTDSGIFIKQGTVTSSISLEQLDTLLAKAKQAELTLTTKQKDFISQLAEKAATQNGIATGDDIASLYLEGEQSASERSKAVTQKQAIIQDGSKKNLYIEFQSQLNSILRLMQSMNISHVDRQVAIGESRKEKFLGFIGGAMEFIPLAEEAAPYIKVGQLIIGGLVGAYEENKYQRSCVKISNLQGNGDDHIGLLSEILARLIVTDQELLDKAKADLAKQDSASIMARIFSSIVKAPTMASRITENKLSSISEEVIYLSTMLLEAIFDDEEFAKKRQAINKDLANQLHSMLRIRMDLSAVRLIEDRPLTDSESEDDIETPARSSTDTMPEQRTEQRTESRAQSRPSIPLLLAQLTEVTKHRKQQLEESGAVTESEVSADRGPIVTQNHLKPTQISQQFSLSVADIESIKLRSATTPLTPNKSRQESNPIAKQLDNLIKLLTLLKQEEYRDIEEEIRIAFYRQIKIINIPHIKSQTNITLLIQNLTEVKDNPDGNNFKEFRKRIKETGDIRNFLLNMSGDIGPQTLKRFNLIRVYKEIANGETATQISEETSDDLLVAISSTFKDDSDKGGFTDNFFEADFTSAINSGLFQSSWPSLTQIQSAEEKQKLEIIDRICRHSTTQDLRRIAEILDLSASHQRSDARFEETGLVAKKQDNRSIKARKLLITKASKKPDDQDETQSDMDIEYEPLLVQRGMPNRDVASSLDDRELEATDSTTKQHIVATPITLADDKRTADTASAKIKPSSSPANIVGGRRHRRKGRGGRK